MKRIGVTGGMGSGKSSICNMWRDMGAFVIDSDNLAKEILSHSHEIKQDVIRIFGPEAYLENGKLNRAFLAQEAFEEGKLDQLTKIVHPSVYKRISDMDVFAEEEGVKVFIREAAILLAHGRPPELDVVVLITAPLEERIRRAMARDGVSRHAVMQRLARQKTDEELAPMCDIVIENTQDLSVLRKTAEELFHQWDA
jgi:dephospho-CoA kinase